MKIKPLYGMSVTHLDPPVQIESEINTFNIVKPNELTIWLKADPICYWNAIYIQCIHYDFEYIMAYFDTSLTFVCPILIFFCEEL